MARIFNLREVANQSENYKGAIVQYVEMTLDYTDRDGVNHKTTKTYYEAWAVTDGKIEFLGRDDFGASGGAALIGTSGTFTITARAQFIENLNIESWRRGDAIESGELRSYYGGIADAPNGFIHPFGATGSLTMKWEPTSPGSATCRQTAVGR
jgi:hypothetical protein